MTGVKIDKKYCVISCKTAKLQKSIDREGVIVFNSGILVN